VKNNPRSNSAAYSLKRPPRFIPPLGPPRASAKERALAQWRGVDSTAAEKTRARPAKTMESILPRVLTTLRMDQRRAEAEIVRVWNNLMDPSVVAHAQPTGIHKGTLFVTIDSSVWLDEIVRYRRKEILERLQHSFGREVVARISFRVG
jgi:predicted nucleic acid-binding Zn ribbon protein